jgi:hypothetical protein
MQLQFIEAFRTAGDDADLPACSSVRPQCASPAMVLKRMQAADAAPDADA